MARYFERFLIGAALVLSSCSSGIVNNLPTSEWYAYNPPENEVAFTQRTDEGDAFTILISEEKKDRCLTVTFRAQFTWGMWFERRYENGVVVNEKSGALSPLAINFVISRMVDSLSGAWRYIVEFSLKARETWRCGMKFDPTA